MTPEGKQNFLSSKEAETWATWIYLKNARTIDFILK